MDNEFRMGVRTAGLIKLLKDNLVGRYKDYFCILQEMLQNADDAKATRVHFGVTGSIGTGFALGAADGFFIVNNGPVSKANMRAIYDVAAGDKGDAEDKIGKFGLGMKSVFHVCEAFVMFGEGHDELPDFPYLCTPWLPPYHKEWHDSFDSAKRDLANEMRKRIPKEFLGQAWFCVWLPLRSDKTLDGVNPIIGNYPDLARDNFTGEEYSSLLVRFLPLLKHVTEISFGDVKGDITRFQLKAEGDGRLLGREKCNPTHRLCGSLTLQGENAPRYVYSGVERMLNDGKLNGLRGCEYWPKYSRWDEQLGLVEADGYGSKITNYDEKINQHVAVCILTEPTSRPTLSVVPCVFLPLSGARDKDKVDDYVCRIDGDCSVTIYLHGNLFISAARGDVDLGGDIGVSSPANESLLCSTWNAVLWHRGVLPMIVDEIAKAMTLWDEKTTAGVIKAFSSLPFVDKHGWLNEICRLDSIVHLLTPDGYSWQKVKSSDQIISDNFIASDRKTASVRRVLCAVLPDNVHIVDSNSGNLMRQNGVEYALPVEIRIAVIRYVARLAADEVNEKLYLFVRDCVTGLKFDELDDDLRRAPIWRIDDEAISYDELRRRVDELRVYCDATTGLKQKFLSAVKWTLKSAPTELGNALGLRLRKLDVDFVIDILHMVPDLGDVGARRELLAEIKRGVVQNQDRRRRAVRYLVHANRDLFDNTAKLYTPDSSLPSDFAEVVVKAISAALYRHSYSIPVEMLASLSIADQDEYGFGRLTSDSVAVVLSGTPGVSYAGFPADAWQTLLKVSNLLFTDYNVKSALKRIPLFPLEDGGRAALSESCYYERSVKIPSVFRSKVHVLSVPKDEDIARRLEELVPSWRYSDTFRYCREGSLSDDQLSKVLVEAVARTPALTGEDRAYLESTKWVPVVDGGYCAPDSIINIPEFTPPSGVTEMLPLKSFDDRILGLLRRHELLPQNSVCVQMLFDNLATMPRYHLGLIRLPEGIPLTCDRLFSIFNNVDVLPIVSMLQKMGYVKSLCDANLNRLIGPIDPNLMLGVITELTTRIRESRESSERQLLWIALCSYLEEAAEYGERMFLEIFSAYDFLNVNMKPCKASVLCTGGESIPSENIVHAGYKAADRFFSRLQDNVSYYVKEDKGAEFSSFKEYFADWDQEFDARIGGFIVCTSDVASDIDFVRRRYWTDSRSIPENRNKLNGEYNQLVSGQCAYLHAKKGSKIIIRTLIGTSCEVPMKNLTEVDDLFVAEGAPLRISPSPAIRQAVFNGGGEKLMIMRLRYVTKSELEKLPPNKLDALLKNTLYKIASALSGVSFACDIDNLWGDLVSGEQLSIAVTRAVMLNHASYYLGMLGCRDDKLDQYFSEQKDLETVIEDARKSKGGSCQQYLTKKDELTKNLGRLIETDYDVAQHILEALRNEMRNRYEYNETSLLYELFQNADDASEQLYAINPDEKTESGRFEVEYDGEMLIVVHWGRVINSVASAGGAGLAHREFKRDLENMLMLMQSGKKNGTISVTGKFGLGFKTVFFVCDDPVIYSGALHFKIRGGFLPQPLADEDNEKYVPIVRRFVEEVPGLKPTVYFLPIVQQQRTMIERGINNFLGNAKTVCTLAKRIGRVRIKTSKGDVKDVRKVAFNGALSADGDRFVINLKDGNLFFGNKNGIPAPLSDDEATYWATVPTKLCLRMGFALNGGFDLTTGRAKINDSSKNNPMLIAKWSDCLYDALGKIDSEVREQGDGGFAFLEALWDLFTVRREIRKWENPETYLLRDLLWDERSGGYRRYIYSHCSMPSGLTGRLKSLCTPTAISHVVSRDVAKYGLPAMLERGSLISGCAVAEEVFITPANRFFKNINGWTKYGMQEFLADLQKERPVLDWQWCSGEAGKRLLQALKECELEQGSQLLLRNFLFMTNGSATNKAENLVGADGYDEKRMTFVPTDYQLCSKYDETGVALFKFIRGERRIRTEDLARLAAKALTLDEQAAVLRYVLETHDIDFTEAFVNCNAAWLKDVVTHPYFIGLDENAQMVLAGMLGLGIDSISYESANVVLPPQSEIDIRTIDWNDVVKWWAANSCECISKYNDLIYDRQVDRLPNDVSTFKDRSEWLELFVMASAFSLGMRDCQHKGFIRMLKKERMGKRTLWDVYADEKSTPQDWMDTLEHFIQQEEFKRQYRYWMGLFMRIYQFASRLSDYVQFVRMLSRLMEVRSFDSILASMANPALNRSGIDVPGLQRVLCERGQAFLLRELVRRGAVVNQRIYPYCFVRNPTLFAGKDSRSIYNSIAFNLHGGDPTFGGAFDIALASYLRDERKADVLYVL